jgi:acetyl esterase/lipase
VHGGGWCAGSRAQFSRHATRLAEALDAVSVCIDYRFASEALFPAPVDDVAEALTWLRTHADELGVAPDAMGLCGGSAGGHLAALVAMGAVGDGGIAGMALFNPVVDLSVDLASHPAVGEALSQLLGGTVEQVPDRYAAASPISYVGADVPPTLVFHGTHDELVPHERSEHFIRSLTQAGVVADLVSAENAGHGFFNTEPWFRPCLDRLVQFAGSIHGRALV